MGIFDTAKDMLGKSTQLGGFATSLQSFISQQGGLQGLKAKFESEGAGAIFQSWVSKGPKLPISQEQVGKVMGNSFITDISTKLGVDPETAKHKIAEMLPDFVGKLTPDGKLPDAGSKLAS